MISNKVSVIVPTYNARETLRDLINSLKNQSNKNFDLIIIDNGTTPKSSNLIKTIDFGELKHEIVYSDENLGPGGGRNKAFLHAKEEIIAFTDDDCIVDRDWIETIANHFEKNINSDVIYGAVYSSLMPEYPFIHAFALDGKVFGSGNCAFKAKFFKKIGGFDINMNTWGEDYEIHQHSLAEGGLVSYVSSMRVNHPPRLQKYNYASQLFNFSFLDKYYYLHKTKKYPIKFPLIMSITKKALLRLSLYILLTYLSSFFLPMHMALLIPILFFCLVASRKLYRLKQLSRHFDPKEKIPMVNQLTYMLISWTLEMVNLVIFVSYKVYRFFVSPIYKTKQNEYDVLRNEGLP